MSTPPTMPPAAEPRLLIVALNDMVVPCPAVVLEVSKVVNITQAIDDVRVTPQIPNTTSHGIDAAAMARATMIPVTNVIAAETDAIDEIWRWPANRLPAKYPMPPII